MGERGSVFGWGIRLQAGRTRGSSLDEVIDFFFNLSKPFSSTIALELTHSNRNQCPKILVGSREQPVQCHLWADCLDTVRSPTSPSRSTSHSLHREMCTPGTYKQCAAPPRRRQVYWDTPWQETYLAQTHFRNTETTRNLPHQNVLVTRTQVKTLYKQQTSHT
jgi:hypothetical protein